MSKLLSINETITKTCKALKKHLESTNIPASAENMFFYMPKMFTTFATKTVKYIDENNQPKLLPLEIKEIDTDTSKNHLDVNIEFIDQETSTITNTLHYQNIKLDWPYNNHSCLVPMSKLQNKRFYGIAFTFPRLEKPTTIRITEKWTRQINSQYNVITRQQLFPITVDENADKVKSSKPALHELTAIKNYNVDPLEPDTYLGYYSTQSIILPTYEQDDLIETAIFNKDNSQVEHVYYNYTENNENITELINQLANVEPKTKDALNVIKEEADNTPRLNTYLKALYQTTVLHQQQLITHHFNEQNLLVREQQDLVLPA